MAANVANHLITRYESVRARIAEACRRAGRVPEDVRLIAVTKDVPAEHMRAVASAGARRFGENYVQEWRAKRERLADLSDVEWHFIGRLQRNKAHLAAEFALVHSVGDEPLAVALERAGARRGTPVNVLIQVNVAGEMTKGGVRPADLPALLAGLRCLAWIRVQGLMAIPPLLSPEEVRPIFRAMRALRDAQDRPEELRELSMGMSADFEAAIEEGATLVRVGRAIFGSREEGA